MTVAEENHSILRAESGEFPKMGTPEYAWWSAGARAEHDIHRRKIGEDKARRDSIGYLLTLAGAKPEWTAEDLWRSVGEVFGYRPRKPWWRRWSASLTFAWYDLWIGAYWDRKSRTLYVCPLPTLLLEFRRA